VIYTFGELSDNMQKIIFIPNQKSPWGQQRCTGADGKSSYEMIDHSDTVGSSLMRACVPYAFMKEHFSDKIQVCYKRTLPDDASAGDIVIFVRDCDHPGIQEAKNRGCITVYDNIDGCKQFNANGKFDIIIANSAKHAEILSKRHEIDLKKIVIIDILHTNVNREKVKARARNQQPVVGAVNPGPSAFLRTDIYEDLVQFSKKNKFDLKNVDYEKIPLSLDVENIRVNNLFECYDGIHIGLSLFVQEHLNYDRLNEKPSTKVTGYSSYDIPVVCSYQRAFDDIIQRFPDFKNYITQDIEHAKSIILRLVQDYDYYMESRSLFHDIGEMFHMDHSYDKYVTQINNAAKMM